MCICIYTHIYIYIYTHTYIYVCVVPDFLPCSVTCRQLQTKASEPSRRASSDHGGHVVGREEAQLVVQAAGPPGWVGAVQDLNHLSAVEPQLIIFESLKVVQRPGPPHSLLGENTERGPAELGPAELVSEPQAHGRGSAGPGTKTKLAVSCLP